jgi:hypothetical protein
MCHGRGVEFLLWKGDQARISYNSHSHNLSVLFTGLIGNAIVWPSLSYKVDLSHYLPEWVTFGFSAATGDATAMHTIQTWDFSLKVIVTKPTVAGRDGPDPKKNNRLGLAVGLGVFGSVLLGGALILFGLWKRSRSHTKEDLVFDRYMDDEF